MYCHSYPLESAEMGPLLVICLSVLSVTSSPSGNDVCMYGFMLPSLIEAAASVLYANGDVRLNVNGSYSINNTLGVLEVFINGDWGTVCTSGFNGGSAAAACRQLGYLDSLSYGIPSKYK